MSAQSAPSATDFTHLRPRTLAHLVKAVDAAAYHLWLEQRGRYDFPHDDARHAAVALFKSAPAILPLLPEPEEPQPDYGGIPLIPRCFICGRGPGAHWPDDCPDRDPDVPLPPSHEWDDIPVPPNPDAPPTPSVPKNEPAVQPSALPTHPTEPTVAQTTPPARRPPKGRE